MPPQTQPDDISGVPIPDPASAQLPPPSSPQEEFLRNAYSEALAAEKEYAKEHGTSAPAAEAPGLNQAEVGGPAPQAAGQSSEIIIPREPAGQPQAVPPPSTVVQPSPPAQVPSEPQQTAPSPEAEDQSDSFKIPR